MVKQIKFPLIMKQSVEVRNIEELRENFDIESVMTYFLRGTLNRWLANNYYDDILESIQELTGEEENIDQMLANALGIDDWSEDTIFGTQELIRKVKIKEKLRSSMDEQELEEMDHIAETQDDIKQFIEAGYKKIYLYGDEFTIPREMKNVECIGIYNPNPVIRIEADSRQEFQERRVKLQNVRFMDDASTEMALDEPLIDSSLALLNVLKEYMCQVENS